MLEEGSPLGEVVVPEEIEGVAAQCCRVLRLQEPLHVLLEGDIHFAVGIRVGRAEAHQALPVGSQQLLAGAEGLESRVVGDPAEDDGPGEGEPLQELRGAHGAVGSVHRAPLLLRHIARLPAARTACEPGPGPGQGQEHRQQPPRRRHG